MNVFKLAAIITGIFAVFWILKCTFQPDGGVEMADTTPMLSIPAGVATATSPAPNSTKSDNMSLNSMSSNTPTTKSPASSSMTLTPIAVSGGLSTSDDASNLSSMDLLPKDLSAAAFVATDTGSGETNLLFPDANAFNMEVEHEAPRKILQYDYLRPQIRPKLQDDLPFFVSSVEMSDLEDE